MAMSRCGVSWQRKQEITNSLFLLGVDRYKGVGLIGLSPQLARISKTRLRLLAPDPEGVATLIQIA